MPNKGSTIKEESKIEITLHIQKDKLRSFIKNYSPEFLIPLPSFKETPPELRLYEMLADKEGYNYQNENEINKLVEYGFEKIKNCLQNSDDIELVLTILCKNKIDNSYDDKLTTLGAYSNIFGSHYYKFIYDKDETMYIKECEVGDIYNDISEEYVQEKTFNKYKRKYEETIGYKLYDNFVSRIYRFKAERLNIGICKFENHDALKIDASNLAEVICILQGKNPGMFTQFNELVSRILPEIKWISVVPRDNSDVEIIVWTIEPKLNRDDLSLPLSLCGSGVSQVLTIVYILVSSEESRTIIIDEPQSFLHPGAARKLIETIKQFPQHQYFISTHSPDIITTADPSNIIKLQYQDCQTTASVLDSKEIESQKEILDELGVRLSDVFGADTIIWVEGETEEKCYPLILEKIAQIPLMGIKILPVGSPDALLDGKQSKRVAEIYKKLTVGAGLFPPGIAFIFDREGKNDGQIEELEKIGFKFLKRRMYENYILNPDSISAIINEEATWLETPITVDKIKEYFKFDNIKNIEQKNIEQKEKEKLFPGIKLEDISDDNWLFKVHGANLLKNLFQNFCGTLLEFKKTTHSDKLTKWLIKNQPEFLSELAKELKECLNKNKS